MTESATWTMWNKLGQLSLTGYTEQEARQLLKSEQADGTLYAENAAGDFIKEWNGPVQVGKPHDLEG